jgi:hypothetical protein
MWMYALDVCTDVDVMCALDVCTDVDLCVGRGLCGCERVDLEVWMWPNFFF